MKCPSRGRPGPGSTKTLPDSRESRNSPGSRAVRGRRVGLDGLGGEELGLGSRPHSMLRIEGSVIGTPSRAFWGIDRAPEATPILDRHDVCERRKGAEGHRVEIPIVGEPNKGSRTKCRRD